jgi:signal transduction histidine kinase/ActR/RegA family two-component response regulator
VREPPITISERAIKPAPPARTRAGRWWLGLPLSRKGAVLTIVPSVVTVVVLVSAFVLQREAADIRDDLRAETNLLVEASLLTEDVGEAEGAVRGYAATGDATMLAPYHAVAAKVPDVIAGLEDRAPPRFADLVTTLGDDATAAMEALGATIERVPAGSPDRESAVGALDPATTAVDGFRDTSTGLRALIYANLTVEVEESIRLQDQTQRVLVVGLLLLIVTSLGGGAVIFRSLIGRTVRLSENVKRYSAGQPMLPSVAAGDEIGQLADALSQVGNTLAEKQHELTASRDAALAATRAKDEFLSRTSHELRTPLSAIIGFGQLLQMEELSEDDRESVDHIVRAGRHLLALINDVLDIAKIETGAVSMSVEPVVLADVVDEAVALVRAQAAERELTLSVDVPGDLAVRADRHRLEQVVLNLLTNAVKYNAHGGRIDVTASVVATAAAVGAASAVGPPEGDGADGSTGDGTGDGTDGGVPDTAPPDRDEGRRRRVCISVADTGTGIAPDEIERLFEPFERLDAAARGIDGSGVGLALSKALVEAMGGSVDVRSTVGEGSTFWFELDADDAAGRPARSSREPAAGAEAERPTKNGSIVLYIEDNAANQHLVARVLRDRVEHLETVAEGRRGLDLARRMRPSVVLLDLDLPDMHGYEVLTRLKADPATAGIPVVVVSADAMRRSRDQLRRAGAAHYLTKPVDVHELCAVLDDVAADRTPPAGNGARRPAVTGAAGAGGRSQA